MGTDVREKIVWFSRNIIGIYLLTSVVCEGAFVTEVNPAVGSLGGETRITIFGGEFSADQFKENDDPDAGNKVYLVGTSGREFSCTVHKDGCTESQIMCYTPRGMPEEDYYVKVKVDGVVVADADLCNGFPTSESCTYKPRADNTPTIQSFSPRSGLPGTLLTMEGRLVTDRYGSNIDSATNGKREKLLRVYAGPQDCALKDNDDFYGLSLNDEESDYGTLICKHKGTSVGFYNASFIAEAPYGRSVADDTQRLAYNDKIYMFQAYTNITSISHAYGSLAGGLGLTIFGNYFDDRAPYVQPRAFVGDTECEITDVVVDEYIVCNVAADPQYSDSKFAGNRGVNFEYWTGTSKDSSTIDSIRTMTSSDSGYTSKSLDETYFYDTNDTMDNYVSRITTLFKPPHTGEYQFFLSADDGAKLFIDGVAAVTASMDWEASSRMNLDENERYLLEIVHYETTDDSFVHLKAKYFNTKFTRDSILRAEQEEQIIRISSSVVYDVQKLTFAQFSSGSSVNEVQTLQVESSGKFRIGLFGAYTEPLTTDIEDLTMQDAINALPVFGSEESVTVTRLADATPSFQLAFISKRGDFPAVTVVKVTNSTDVSYNVNEDVKGTPDQDTVALSLEGSVSQPFSVAALSESNLNAAINGMFEARCPGVFESISIKKYYQSFESDSGDFYGTRVSDTEPFCGRYVLKDPRVIYRKRDDDVGIMMSSYKWLCFAYKGFLQNNILSKVSYKSSSDGEVKTVYRYLDYTFKTDSDTESNTWYYTCYNIFDPIYDMFPSDTLHRLDELRVYSLSSEQSGYIDSVFIGRDATTDDPEVGLRRQPPAMPNGALINEVVVAASSSTEYEVTLKPFDCGDALPLFSLANADVTKGRLAYPNSFAKSGLSNGNGDLSVDRTSTASPPVSGFIGVEYNGNSKSDLNVSLEASEFDRELESLNGIGSLSVEKNGDCANFDLVVTFLTLPGDLPQMVVSDGQLSGISPTARLYDSVDGGLFYDPLTGDMVSTVHSTPQVRLHINDVPTSCDGDCSFEWQSSATPTVAAVSPSSGTSALGTSAVISGSGFNADSSQNTVTIGGVECTVNAATTSSITCDVGNGPVGDHKVEVNVNGKGDAQYSGGDVMFEYTADISGIVPQLGSLGGGVLLNINGYGFKKSAEVTINSAICDIVNVRPDQIDCTVPAMTSEGAYDVVVNQGSTSLTFSSFTYTSSLTAIVDTISPSTVGAQGGSVTITGSSFSSSASSVFIGSVEAEVTSWSDSEIVVEVSDVIAGTHDLLVLTQYGTAVDGSGNIPSITVDLSVSNVFPLHGSLLGGTELTLTGSGFGTNDSLVDVQVGDVSCDVTAVTNTEIKCQIGDAATTHQVTNGGTDPGFGIFYAYDRPHLTINQGDYVQWSWETPDFVNDVAHAIIEVGSPSSTTPKDGGFSSGTPMKNGQFRYQFTDTGTYYIWSGYVDPWNIKHYAGVIEVVDATSYATEITVQVAGVEALHNVGGTSNPVDSSSCQASVSKKSGCSDSKPSGDDDSRFNFAFWSCSTPIVTSIDRNNGTAQSTITISGEGFSSEDCQNEVSFGGYPCDVTYSSDSMIECSLAKSAEPELGVLLPLAVRVGNRGNALVSIVNAEDKAFGLIPSIETITPTAGSKAGGTRITITGFGFGDSPYVSIGGDTCDVIESSYTEIICESQESSQETDKDIEVSANINLPAECETSTKTCRFLHYSQRTPHIYTVDPDSMSSTTTFNITGESLGTITANLEVTIGGEAATVLSAANTYVTASIDNIPAGDNDVMVRVISDGKADGDLTVSGLASITGVSPSSGSIHGQTTITVSGNGFVFNETTVTIDGSTCEIVSTTLSEVTCVTASHAAGSVSVNVVSNGVTYSQSSFTYASGSTPTISSLSPTSGLEGETLTISGSNLGPGTATVSLDDADCAVTSSSNSQIQCTLGAHATGSVPVAVFVDGLGTSNTDVEFEYQLSLNSIAPAQGGTAGGQTLVLSGTGFDDSATVTVCGLSCSYVSTSSTEYTCKTPVNTAQTCDVVLSLNGLTRTLSSVYTYNAALTPSISSVNPTKGGTGGGTSITISGSGFGSDVGSVSVLIDDSECVVATVTSSEIVCSTGPHMGSVEAKVEVQVSGNGIAEEASAGDADYSYIDVWSSSFTWGGGSLPQAGEFIIIPPGMTLLLDTDTPVLSFLLIQGGKLIFDNKDVHLQSNIIMITDGGLLQVGTESEPFQHKAIITLHGHHRSKELPIYGTKVLAVRNGTLDLHGIEVPLTWTRLASTASAGSNTLVLQSPVEWNVGDEIVIASTSHKHSQSENEKKRITDISSDGLTLTLDSALEAEHSGTEETFDGTLVEFRAEVGLLTHNVVVRGNGNPEWETEIEACEDGFDTGEFATQTCFLGRFGDEIGSSQFGAMILVHAPAYDTHEAQARISYTEVTFAGQAFRLGRYPIHFHLNGDMSTSYVRGCGIHHTFNRAVNIHGTHNTLVEKTVIYNIMGGAFFLEDGIETGNTIQYNLAVFVRESSSLLNDDITPASFWVTNPNNTLRHNAAAGGTHFGYWYRMHDHPEGPSYTPDVCPVNVPLGQFYNNTAHSFGWFGLWIFANYFPLKGGCGGTEAEPAVFEKLFAWNCDKGAEAVNSGALQFKDFVLVQNKLAGYEGKLVRDVPLYTDDAPMIADSLIVGTTTVIPSSEQGCTKGGLIYPYGNGFRAVNVRFVNFANAECVTMRWARIDGTCTVYCGGFNYHIEAMKYINAPNKGYYAWDWEGIILDKDGTSTGKSAGWTIVPTSGTLPSDCESAPEFSMGNKPASMCPPQYKWHRFAFHKPLPVSLEGKNFLITNEYGTSSVPYAQKRISHQYGWQCALLGGTTYTFQFEFADQIHNISFTGQFYGFESDDYVFAKLEVEEVPDRFSLDDGNTFINATVGGIDPSIAHHGDWEWDNVNSAYRFLIHGRTRQRRGSGGMSTYDVDRPVGFTSYKCYYADCIPPPDPDTVPPETSRPLDFELWHLTSWNQSEDGYVTNSVGAYGVPQDNDDVKIAFDSWVVVNMTGDSVTTIKLGTLLLEGVLEFFDTPGAEYMIEADFIIIKGGRLIIGWPDDAFDGLATISLRGNHSTPHFEAGDGPTIGAKAVGVFGGLDLFGKDVGTTWTQIASTAEAGSNQITLKDQVQWTANDEIVLGTTSFNAWHTESFKIVSVASDNVTLTLNGTLKHRHVAYQETLSNGQEIEVAAAVGLLSRNIKLVGEAYSKMYDDSFGARVIIGVIAFGDQTYTGYARLSNVEFYHTGQEGFTEEYDPRFSVAYVATGSVNNVKPSKITNCAFHNGFNTAIGAFGTGDLEISGNVVFGSIGEGIRTSSNGTRVINNLVALVVATSTYQNRFEPYSFRYEAGIEALSATHLTLLDNLVTGSERIGYHVAPLDCDDTSGRYQNNRAFANLIGVFVLPDDSLPNPSCAKFANFTVWKSHDYGIYYQNSPSLVTEDNIYIDNRNGLFPIVIQPATVDHMFAEKTITVRRSTFVGQSDGFDCINDVTPANDDNFVISIFARPSYLPTDGLVGLIFPNFHSATNNAPGKPFANIMSYNAIGGLMTISDVTFAKFTTTSCKKNFAISTSANNDDLQHPIESTSATLIGVDDDNKIFYHRPNVVKINSADCVDMDCDGMKKALFKDMDGTFLGHQGSVISQSEFEWDENPVRGLGDYRIPKELVTDTNGDRIPYEDIAPYKGIIRNDNCTYRGSWQAYECGDDLNYDLLVIESMDEDTEVRRISPVAVLGDGYVDLINGPQDHGWCSGYTCRLRVSTFHAMVATDKEYVVHFSSLTPENLRYRLLNVEPEDSVKLSVWYSRSNRLDVYVDDVYVPATNSRMENGRYITAIPQGNEFEPQLSNATGTNFFDKDTGYLTFIVAGKQRIDVITQKTVIVVFGIPALSVDDFFGDSIVENMANFLSIPLTKIRVVNVVSASASRRKRTTDGVTVEIEIGDEPASSTNGTVSDSMDYSSLLQLAADIVNECQVGNVSESFNVSGACEQVEVPSDSTSDDPIVYNTPSPDHLYFHTELEPEYEGVLLRTQPKIRAADISNVVVTELGTAEFPWQLTASLRSGTGHPSAVLNGTLTINCTNGWFNFTDLEISHMGSDYMLDFNVTYPLEAVNFTQESASFDVAGRPLQVHVYDQTSGDIVRNARFSVTLDLLDANTEEIISDVAWRDHTWTAEASLLGNSQYGSLDGALTSAFDPSTGLAVFPDLNITGFGMYYVQFRVVSDPADFNITLNHKLNIMHPNHVGMTVEESYYVELKFDVDYNKVLPTEDQQNEFEQMILTVYANMWPDVMLTVGSIREGSIVVTFSMSGSQSDVNATAYSVCETITNGTTYSYNGYDLKLSQYMTIDNTTFYGVSCGEKEEEEDEGMEAYLIAIIVLLSVLIVAVVVGLVVWRCVVKPQTKTTAQISIKEAKSKKSFDANMPMYLGYSEKGMENYLFRDASFTSMKFGATKQVQAAPLSTTMSGDPHDNHKAVASFGQTPRSRFDDRTPRSAFDDQKPRFTFDDQTKRSGFDDQTAYAGSNSYQQPPKMNSLLPSAQFSPALTRSYVPRANVLVSARATKPEKSHLDAVLTSQLTQSRPHTPISDTETHLPPVGEAEQSNLI